jgi:hypothetical protein
MFLPMPGSGEFLVVWARINSKGRNEQFFNEEIER